MRERIRKYRQSSTFSSLNKNGRTDEIEQYQNLKKNSTTILPYNSQQLDIEEEDKMKKKPNHFHFRNLRIQKRRLINDNLMPLTKSLLVTLIALLSFISFFLPNVLLLNQITKGYWTNVISPSPSHNYLLGSSPSASKRAWKRRQRTSNISFQNTAPQLNFEPLVVANVPVLVGGVLAKCDLNNPHRVLITGILSSSLAMGLALSLSLQYQSSDCVRIIGIDSLLPNTPSDRWKFIERLQTLKKHNIPFKMIIPFSGMNSLGMSKSGFIEELDRMQLTHVIHLLREDINISPYREIHQSMVSMQQILDYIRTKKKVKLIYVSATQGDDVKLRYEGLKKADEVLASTYYSLYGISSVGVRLPPVFGAWSINHGNYLSDFISELVQNATLSPVQNDQNLNLISVNDAIHAIISAMQHSAPGAIVFNVQDGVEKTSLSSVTNHLQQVWDSHPSDYPGLTKFQKSLHQAIGWQYYNAYRYGPAPYDKSFAKNMWKSALPKKFPCISECSHADFCAASELDNVAPLLQFATKKCRYIVYSENFDREFDFLENVQEHLEEKPGFCYLMFMSRASPLFRKPQDAKRLPIIKGWISVFLPKSALTPTTSVTIKLSPTKLFSPMVQLAMYFRTKAPPPFYVLDQIFEKMNTPYQRKRNKWKRAQDGTKYKVSIPEEPPRRLIFMASKYNIADIEKLKMGDVLDAIRTLKYEMEDANKDEISSVGQEQLQFYEMAYTMIKSQLLREPLPVEIMKVLQEKKMSQPIYFPMHWIRSTWMMHDVRYGRQFRCDAYHEQLFWNNDYLEDWGLMFTYAKWFGANKIGEVEHGEFTPLLDSQGEKMADDRNVRLYIRILNKAISIRPR